jgi:hypothetical protein
VVVTMATGCHHGTTLQLPFEQIIFSLSSVIPTCHQMFMFSLEYPYLLGAAYLLLCCMDPWSTLQQIPTLLSNWHLSLDSSTCTALRGEVVRLIHNPQTRGWGATFHLSSMDDPTRSSDPHYQSSVGGQGMHASPPH